MKAACCPSPLRERRDCPKWRGLIQKLREQPPREVEGYAVEKIVDYQNDPTGLPRSNVLRFFLTGGQEAVVRPSGTEPLIRVMVEAKTTQIAEETAGRLAGLVRSLNIS